MKKTLIALTLVGVGYLAGAVTPAGAYTDDTTRLMNNIVTELKGINRSLTAIERKLR